MKHAYLRLFVMALGCMLFAASAQAHSGKARFHMIIDTDAAADDLRTLCMLLGNREAEVLAVTTTEGALSAEEAGKKVKALLLEFHHEGVPVGVGRANNTRTPEWRQRSQQIAWVDSTRADDEYPSAVEILYSEIDGEEEPVVLVALGPLTNIGDLIREHPDAVDQIERIVWYGAPERRFLKQVDANYDADRKAARDVLRNGIPLAIVASNPDSPMEITSELIDSIARIKTPYARKIVSSHRSEPLSTLIGEGHLKAWDDLVAVYLYEPSLFKEEPTINGHTRLCMLKSKDEEPAAEARILKILKGLPDAENRVFYAFPTRYEDYSEDVIPIMDRVIDHHGESEWRAAVLTNELHGHLGVYALVGVKMGIRAREYFNIGVDDFTVVSYAGSEPPISCMNDGLQVGTGATIGHGLITVAKTEHPRPEATFTFKGKTIRLQLKREYADRIREDVRRGVALYGKETEPYWKYVRKLALEYWDKFDRHDIFDLYVEN